jgi:D-alanine-D-alanine ligase
MSKIRVGVVRGGPSSEYEVSLRSGATILKHLDPERYEPIDILLTRKGEWIVGGLLVDLPTIAHRVDVIWNSLHGEFGEDGKVQRQFEHFRIPYTGSTSLSSAIAMNKALTKERFKELGIRTPHGTVIEEDASIEDAVFHVFRNYAMPVVVKPVSAGSSVGVTIAENYEQLLAGVEKASEWGAVLVEEMISGKEATCAVLDTENGGVLALHPIEIIPDTEKSFFDYEAKYEGKSREICPGNFTIAQLDEIRRLSARIHQGIGLRHYSRSDFIVSPRGIYALEVNTLPGMTEASLVPLALRTAGVEISEFIDHVIRLAIAR